MTVENTQIDEGSPSTDLVRRNFISLTSHRPALTGLTSYLSLLNRNKKPRAQKQTWHVNRTNMAAWSPEDECVKWSFEQAKSTQHCYCRVCVCFSLS